MKRHIELLARWQNEAPDVAAVEWLKVRAGIVRNLCRRFSVTPDQVFPRCSKTPLDFAEETIERYLLGEILWNRPELPTTARMIALLNRAAEHDVLDQSCRRRNGKRIARSEESIDEPGADPLVALGGDGEQQVNDCGGCIDLLLADLDARPDPHPRFRDYVDLQLQDFKPAEIARELRIPVTDVHNMRKRLKRRLLPLIPASMLEGRSGYESKPQRRQRVQHA